MNRLNTLFIAFQLKKEEREHEEEESKKKMKVEEDGMDDLAQAILARRQLTTENFLEALEKKYSSPNLKKNGKGRKSKS